MGRASVTETEAGELRNPGLFASIGACGDGMLLWNSVCAVARTPSVTIFLGGVGSVVFMVLSDGDQNIWEVYKIKGFIRICAESVILSCRRF